jgi:hypothetical protein
MKPSLLPALLAFLSGICSSPADAQWPDRLTPGTRIRVRLPEVQYQETVRRGHLIRGRVTALAPDTLYVAVTDSVGPLAVPRSLIRHLDLSRGVPSRGSNALRQGIIQGAVSALTLVLLLELDDRQYDTGEAALVGGGVGFGIGAIFGALFPRERWKSLRIPP